MDLKNIPTETLQEAVLGLAQGQDRPVNFVCRKDGTQESATSQEIRLELTLRNLDKETSTLKYYDRTFIDGLRASTNFQHPNGIYTSTSGMIQSAHSAHVVSVGPWQPNINGLLGGIAGIGGGIAEIKQKHPNFIQRFLNWFSELISRVSIGKGKTKVDDTIKDTDRLSEEQVSKVVLDS